MRQELDPQLIGMYVQIGKKVRELRKSKAKMSYIDFAKKIGMDKKTYYKIETGTTGEYYVGSLMRVISYYDDLTAEKLFKSVGI